MWLRKLFLGDGVGNFLFTFMVVEEICLSPVRSRFVCFCCVGFVLLRKVVM